MRRARSYKSRDASGVRNDEATIDALYSQRIDRVPCPLVDDGSSQATGAGGDLEVKVKTGAAALFTFDGQIEELAAETQLTLFATAATILPNVDDFVAWIVGVRLQSGPNANMELFAMQGAVGNAASPAPEDSLGDSSAKPAEGYLAAMKALCPNPRQCAILGTVLVRRSADTTLAIDIEHAFQLAQRFSADQMAGGDDYIELLEADE